MAVILELALYLIQLGIMLLLFSIKLTWRLLKFEFYRIRWSFKQYPFGFFSFFLHFIGYWLAMYLAEAEKITWLLKFYTFGLADNIYDAAGFVLWPIETFFELLTKIPSDSWLFGVVIFAIVIAMILLWLVIIILFFESVFFLIPLIHAILTQLVLGLIFRPYLLKWRQWRSDKFFEKVHKRSQADPELQAMSRSISQQMGNVQQSIADQYHHANQTSGYQQSHSASFSMERELRQMGLTPKERLNADGTGTGIMEVELPDYRPARRMLRDFDETYHKFYDRICDKSMKCYQAKETLKELAGERREVERVYSDMLEKHYEMLDCYNETFDLVCFSEDESGIPAAYADFKRNLMLVKNAQEEFGKTIKSAYGEKLLRELLEKEMNGQL